MARFLLTLFFPFIFIMALRCSVRKADPWRDIHPFWGERPGVDSESLNTECNGSLLACHLLRGAENWVQVQRHRFDCLPDEPNEIDSQLITALGHSGAPCTIWRSALRYDLEGTHHQAVQPTFICFENGDCLFYLYDWYNHVSLDAIPPTCPVMKRMLPQAPTTPTP